MKKNLKNKLRIRFVLLSMLSLFFIQSLIVGVSIAGNYQDLVEKSDLLISQLHHNPSGSSRYFSVKIPAGKDRVYPDTVQHVTVSAEEAADFAHRVLKTNQEKGFIDEYRYHIFQNESGTKIYFLYRASGIEMYRAAAKNMIFVSFISFLTVGALLIPVSRWVVKPLVENHQKQKQFITAAGHELKTPLAVIRTNAQLLETEIGNNVWLDGIQNQVSHLTQLTCDLVTLSKAEEVDTSFAREHFSFSEILHDERKVYQGIEKQNKLQVKETVSPELPLIACKNEVRRLIRNLLDNAYKYCPENGCIDIEAKPCFQGVRFVISNTTEGLSEENVRRLSQRFYRGKNAEGKDGFGLGLSIAAAIVAQHNGHFAVSFSPENKFRVEILLRSSERKSQ